MKRIIKSSILLYSLYLFLLPLLSILSIVTPNPIYAQTPRFPIPRSTPTKTPHPPGTTPVNPTPTSPPNPQVRFLYDGDGAKVAKIEDGITTLFIGDTEKQRGNNELTKYYRVGKNRIATKQSSQISFLVNDHLGSLRTLTNLQGNKLSENRYYPYGSSRNPSNISLSRQYSNQLKDNSTLLYNYGSRDYEPRNGLFISPEYNGKSLNKYSFTAGNPIRFIDSNGRSPEDSLAQLLCQRANPSGCFSPPGPYWDEQAKDIINTMNTVRESIRSGKVDPTYANNRILTDTEAKSAGELSPVMETKIWGDAIPLANGYDFQNINNAHVSNVNYLLWGAITAQENWFGPHYSNAHVGSLFMMAEEYKALPKYLQESDDLLGMIKGAYDTPDKNVIALIYTLRAKCGNNDPGKNQSLVINNKINPAISKLYYAGDHDWLGKVQSWYDLLAKFAKTEPGFEWWFDDITQLSPKSLSPIDSQPI
jgi:RHS repeat-associated protein